MISASSSFLTKNAVLNKQPILVLLLRNCPYAFYSGGSISGSPSQAFPDLKNGALCGAFTDSGGNVVQPVALGCGPTTLIVPAGATQLQLGSNDVYYPDNTGSWTVEVTVGGVTSTVTVSHTHGPWLFTGGINSLYPYSSSGPPSATCVAATGLIAGEVVQVEYISGTMGPGSPVAATDADGSSNITGLSIANGYMIGATLDSNSSGGLFPSTYMGSILKPWLVNLGDHKTTVSDLDGGTDVSNLVFNVQDWLQSITALFPTYVFEGQRITLLQGHAGMALSDFTIFFTGLVQSVASANGNAEYQFTCTPLNTSKLTNLIYQTGDDGFPIDSKHPRTVTGHPIDIYVSALEQAGVPSGSIDSAKLYFYRDTIYSGLEYEFSLTKAPTAKDFIDNELMKPLGAYRYENSLGLMTANFFCPALSGNGSYTPPSLPIATETQDTALEVPIAGEADLVNSVQFQFDDDGTGNGNFLGQSLQQYGLSIEKYGLVGNQIIQSQGMRSAFQGFLWSQFIALLIFLRYGLKNLLLDPVPFMWSECLLEPGDVIALTLSQVPNRSGGTFGITAMTFEVLDVNRKFMTQQTELKLLALDISKFKQYLITPNAESTYPLASGTDQGKYMFLSDATGKYSTAAAGNTLG